MTLAHPLPAAVPIVRPLVVWLAAVAALLVVMILVGGLTRLTDSGLAIVEWRPVTGMIPPLSEADWQIELSKYRQCAPEYALQNRGMSMADFQFIYWWEWGHRQLGRLIGLVYALPLAVFWWRGMIPAGLHGRLLLLLGLGGLQGAIGWWMVQSGLSAELRDCLAAAAAGAPVPEFSGPAPVDVKATRLAVHLGLAFVIFGLIVWTIRDLVAGRAGGRLSGLTALGSAGLVVLIFGQILLGALVAGTDAGLTYNTWPLMDGRFVPDGLLALEPWSANFTQNITMIQFQHRIAAYLIVLAAGFHWIMVMRSGAGRAARLIAHHVLGLVLLQVAIGIWTLLAVAPLPLSALHQGLAVALFGAAVLQAHVWMAGGSAGAAGPRDQPRRA